MNSYVLLDDVLSISVLQKCCLTQNVADGDPQILYSLYGIVEHSGTMRSGHYTAYVKVRPEGPQLASNGLAGQGKQI